MHLTWRDLDLRHSTVAAVVALFLMHLFAHESWLGAVTFAAMLFVATVITHGIMAGVQRRRDARDAAFPGRRPTPRLGVHQP